MNMRSYFNTLNPSLAIVVGSLFTCAVNGAKYILAQTGENMYTLINLATGDCRKNAVEIPHFADGIDEDDFHALIGKKTDLDDWHLVEQVSAADTVAPVTGQDTDKRNDAFDTAVPEEAAPSKGVAVPVLIVQLVLP